MPQNLVLTVENFLAVFLLCGLILIIKLSVHHFVIFSSEIQSHATF